MNPSPDSIALLIASGAGCLLGSFITALVMGTIAQSKARRADKEAWEAANIYYTRKAAQAQS